VLTNLCVLLALDPGCQLRLYCVLQCVVVCCSAVSCVAVRCSTLLLWCSVLLQWASEWASTRPSLPTVPTLCVAVRCSVMQRVAVCCCSVLQRSSYACGTAPAVCRITGARRRAHVLQCVAYSSILRLVGRVPTQSSCVAVCCSVLHIVCNCQRAHRGTHTHTHI